MHETKECLNLAIVVHCILVLSNLSGYIEGGETTDSGTLCYTTDQCTIDKTICKDDSCHCDNSATMYVWDGTSSCITKMDQSFTIKVPSNVSIDVLDFLQLKGLQCGNVTGDYYRLGHLDQLPDKCFDKVFFYFSSGWIYFSPSILHGKSQCSVSYSNIDTSANNYRCLISQYGFQLVVTAQNTFIGGVYSKANSLGFMTKKAGVDLNIDNASVLESSGNVDTSDSISIQIHSYKHPKCVTTSSVSLEKCPANTSLPMVDVHKNPENTDVKLGDNVELRCNYISLTNLSDVQWEIVSPGNEIYRPGVILSSAVFTITLNVQENYSKLIIIGVSQQQVLRYRCVVINENGRGSSEVSVVLTPELPAPNVTSDIEETTLGQNATISCSVPDVYPQVLHTWWERENSDPVDMTEDKYSIIDQTYNLHIRDVVFTDLGYYTCCANNTMGMNCSAKKALGAPPVEVNISLNGEVELFHPLTITCSVRAFPPVMYVGMSTKSRSYTSTASSNGSKLETVQFVPTSSMQISDNDNYWCVAYNGIRSSIRSDIIAVSAYGIAFSNGNDSDVVFGEMANISCPINYIYPQEVNITWLLNDTCLCPNEYILTTSLRLVQFRADFSRNGMYKCHVDNGQIEKTSSGIFLHVLGDIPKVSSKILFNDQEYPRFLSVNRSDSVELICNILASPSVLSIHWKRENDGAETIFPVSISSPNLPISSVALSDGGNYTCNVSNAVGSATGNTVTLHVKQTEPMCPCQCAFKLKLDYWNNINISKDMLLEKMAPLMEEVLNDMKIDKTQVSAVIRKLTSAPDDRKSAEQIGTLGIVMIAVVFGFIILFDVISFLQWCLRKKQDRND